MEIKLLSCPLCLKPHFEGVDSLRSTLVSVATSHLTCPVCSDSLLGLDKLTIHLFSHINNLPHVEVNNETNNNVESDHVLDEIDESIKNIAENEQQIQEKNVSENQEIQQSVKNEETNKRIKCDICNFSFNDQNILDMHQKLLHQTIPDKKTGQYSYHCHLCSKKFRMRGSLMVHLRVAHYGFDNQNNEEVETQRVVQSEERKIKPKPQDTESEEKRSNEVKNSPKPIVGNRVQDNKQWECDVCSKMFTTKYFLKKHKRLHTGEMPYSCTICSKSFTFQQSYHKHMLYHSSEKPYVCNECGRAFKELSTLQNHARIHSGERPFGCETCGKRFRQRVSYLVHRRIHTGVMPYKCTACDKSFRYKVSQRSHKCPMSPPGTVIKVPENSATEAIGTASVPEAEGKNNVKCIMSVDYNTGNINLIPENNATSFNVIYLGNPGGYQETVPKETIVIEGKEHIKISYNKSDIPENIKNQGSPIMNQSNDVQMNIVENVLDGNNSQALKNANQQSNFVGNDNTNQPDLYSIVLSPLLPEVGSLRLTSPPETPETPNDNLIHNEILEELFYGSQKK